MTHLSSQTFFAPADAPIEARTLVADLHAHSNVSDGTLAPSEVVARAHAHGVQIFALTDHDEVAGLAPASQAAQALGLHFVPGVEISVTWSGLTIHVVGLGIDADHVSLRNGLARVRAGRLLRAQSMADGLAQAGIEGAYEGALRHATNREMLSRTHFARWMVQEGRCASVRDVFGRYLTPGKPGYVPHAWATLSEAVSWIRGAGGTAVIAHPGRYALNTTEMWALICEFREAGGEAIEVATSNHSADHIRRFTQLALEFGLEGSRGSDFHGPNESHAELGRSPWLPDRLTPVWHRFL